MFKEIDHYNEINTKLKFSNRIEDLRKKYQADKQYFSSRIHLLTPLQIQLESLLLDYENEIYFCREEPSLISHKLQILPKNEKFFDVNEINNDFPRRILREAGKMYKCAELGCEKIYTSLHGLKYHREKGHLSSDYDKKPYICAKTGCKKRYKNSNGLKYHLEHYHKCK
ncbi:C2H2-type DNA- Zinc finger protein [Tubulinosema ratisbonensis]|uniref:C2H2-type DNA-Zinc finger protein n=1 Tax=Tubulinosema ratisbonensis TaxID=291195 RepID=A0A437ANX9_9MICR|nr:C2H2-type DNA- Zinc finger protein [Tubulinosema ratisbonensis]